MAKGQQGVPKPEEGASVESQPGKRGRVSDAEAVQIRDAAASGAAVPVLAKQFNRSERAIEKLLHGSPPDQTGNKATRSVTGTEAAGDLRTQIEALIEREVQNRLKAALKIH